jgi:hypothetical protein
MLSQDQIETYRRDGVLSAADVAAPGKVTDSFPGSLRTGPRMVEVPVRLPLPAPKCGGSIYGTHREVKTSYFAPSQLAKAMT